MPLGSYFMCLHVASTRVLCIRTEIYCSSPPSLLLRTLKSDFSDECYADVIFWKNKPILSLSFTIPEYAHYWNKKKVEDSI